ncbi:MAG: rRNA maturation RNase YbeY [Patescibacteria group bacterium]
MTSVSIKNLTRRPVPRFAYTALVATVLPQWDVSLVFVGPKKAQELNMQLRKKSYTPNVLSYEVGKKSGEIFICLQEAERQAPAHSMNSRIFVLYLFIHGLLHLKGWAHSGTMEQCERKLLKQFSQKREV